MCLIKLSDSPCKLSSYLTSNFDYFVDPDCQLNSYVPGMIFSPDQEGTKRLVLNPLNTNNCSLEALEVPVSLNCQTCLDTSDLRIKCEPNLVDIKPEFASNAISVQTGDVQQTGTEIFTESSHVKKELKCDGIKRIPKSRKQVKYFSEIVDHDTTKARVVGETAYNEHLYNLFQKKQQEGLRIRNSKN